MIEKVFLNSNGNLKYFSFLQSKKIPEESNCENIIKIAKYFPGSFNTSLLTDEWHLLQTEKLSSYIERNYHSWRSIFEIKNAIGQTKSPLIQKIVKMCLCVSHGSADIERDFSLSGRIIIEDKTNMNERTLNAKLYIFDALKHYIQEVDLVRI